VKISRRFSWTDRAGSSKLRKLSERNRVQQSRHMARHRILSRACKAKLGQDIMYTKRQRETN
jgi:hypothetical protein